MAEEDTEYKKLPIDERCVHKLWKARVDGYEEAAKLFRTIDDEKSPEWSKFIGLIKKFVVDSNAVAQEKGLEAALLFVENCGHAGKVAGEVISGVVTKCLGAPKAKTRDLGTQIALMFIEIERHDAAVEELIKGFDQKNPKIVANCVVAVNQALREFGSKVVNVKPLVKKIPALLSDRDKTVRDEAKSLTVEIFRWIGPAFKTQIQSLPQVVLTELEAEFEKAKSDKPNPTRYLKSQQPKYSHESGAAVDANGNEEQTEEDEGEDPEIDPNDFLDPVEILSKLPKDFYDKIEAKKWQERKEQLDAVEALASNPKLQTGDYGELVRTLKKVIAKDTNVVLVAAAGKCLCLLAKGLGKKFQPYAAVCISGALEKFKEKKNNVVMALRDAIDAIYPSTNLEAIQEDVLAALGNKNPNVKTETALFIARSLTKTQPAILNKKLVKAYVTALLKNLCESDPAVRESSAEALGTMMKLLGDKNMAVYLTDVDSLKMEKIKEACEKAVITVKIPTAKKETRPQTAPAKSAKGGSNEPKPVTRPATASTAGRKAPAKKATSSSANALPKSASSKNVLPTERDLTPEEVDERVAEILSPDIVPGLGDGNWKTRLAAVENFIQITSSLEAKNEHSQVLIKTLARKPGLKDTNFQVLKLRLDAVAQIIDRFGITVTTSDVIINDVTEKLGDAKSGSSAAAVLTAMAEAIKLEYVVSKVMSFSFEQKSPKVQQESLLWVNQAIKEFGFQLNPKVMIDDAKKGVNSTTPTVRQATITLLGTMFLYMGNTLSIFFDGEKPALRQLIQSEFDKYVGQKPPTPTRGPQVKSGNSASYADDDEGEEDDTPAVKIADLIPRVDISPMITESLINELNDKNWKQRNEALEKLKGIIDSNKLIKPSLGELPPVLAQRLIDSNAKLAQAAIEITQLLATAMGASFKQHVRVFLPGVLKTLGDNKPYLRAACITCINLWSEQCGYKEFFEGEMFADALKNGTPQLRIEVWTWLSDKLPDLPPKSVNKEELIACLPYLYASISDRNVDVRKYSNDCVLGFMIHLGYDAMMKVMEKQKPASRKDIQAALDKARPSLPVKPLPKGKQSAPIVEEKKVVKAGQSKLATKQAQTSKPGSASAAGSRKKEEDIDLSPMFQVNNLKTQRLLDEQKLKVLKWNFTTPRDEFTDLLKEQMTTANLNRTLMANMFHDDFRYHLKVIETLTDDLDDSLKGLICNLDLILKWVSLRFYDTNPSVLLKGLEYLNNVFQRLVDNSYCLTDIEGSSFVPHLLTKIGDPKDAVRNGVRQILRQICLVYPFSKVFVYLMDALKSKNARQRTECLDELGYLIETYGTSACQPTPQHALKEIARQISDRDNSVRSAALNCIVKAYEILQDKVYKMIGQLNEKDLSMLDERIRRSRKTPKPVMEVKPSVSNLEIINVPVEPEEEYSGEEELPSEEEPQPVNKTFDNMSNNRMNNQVQRGPSGPFRLDEGLIAEIEHSWIRSEKIHLADLRPLDLGFLNEPIKIKPYNGVSYPSEKLAQLLTTRSPTRPQSAAVHHQTTCSPHHLFSSPTIRPSTAPAQMNDLNFETPKLDAKLTNMIKGIGHPDRLVAHASLNELSDILDSPEKQAVLRDYEEIYIMSVLDQFKHLSQRPLSEALTLYQPLLSSLYNFFSSKSLGQNLGLVSIKNLISVLLGLMSDHKFGPGEEYTKVINSICLKILDKTNFTHLNCALVRLLKETCSGSALPKFTELLMKCIWRNVKLMGERANELEYEALLMEIHDFMLTLPSQWWAQRPSDTPMRTIKTIIHNMTKIKGTGILNHLNNIPIHSELNTYVLRILKKEQPVTSASDPHRSSQNDRLNKNTHEEVSNIFKLISDKETSKLGLKQLYEFKEKHPDVDINPFLKGASAYFQEFITEGLAELENQNNGNNNAQEYDNNNETAQLQGNSNPSSEYWMQKLNAYRVRGKLQGDEKEQQIDNKIADENLNMNQIQSRLTGLSRKDVDHIPASRLSLLQQKLAQYKHT